MPCTPGTYADTSGNSTCKACPVDTYSDTGASECHACPPPQHAGGDCMREICNGNRVITSMADATDRDDGVACTVDACSSGKASHTPDDSRCDDHDPCTSDRCAADGFWHTPALDCRGGEEDAGPTDADGGARLRDAGTSPSGGAAAEGGEHAAASGGERAAPGAGNDADLQQAAVNAGRGASADAGAPIDAGAPSSELRGSCDCSVGPRARPRPALPWLWLGLALIWRRRRRAA
jgi:MYXO-CTERM domain-containing protein